MEIKLNNQTKTYLELFDIMDSSRKETNLSKILSYILARNPYALKKLLNLIDPGSLIIKNRNAKTLLKNTSIEIEHSYSKEQLQFNHESGRTDIEIKIFDKKKLLIFVIIECKVHENRATITQFEKYKNIYRLAEQNKAAKKYFVYLSNQSGINLLDTNDIEVIDLNWREIINGFYEIQEISNENDTEFTKFINYYERNYGMSNQKEILVQDVGIDSEIDRFFNGVYRRNKVNGSPLYFAPYFTRNSKIDNEGICNISKILGIITINDITWEKIENSCKKFIDLYDNECEYKNEILEKWKKGIKIDIDFNNNIEAQKNSINNTINEKKAELEKNYSGKYVKSKDNLMKEICEFEELSNSSDRNIEDYWKSINYTYYFLNNPIELEKPLVKDGGNKTGRGKNWIAAAIPQNRCVSFEDFITHSSLLKQ